MAKTIEKPTWTVDGQVFQGHVVSDGAGKKPAVMVFHAWAGQGEFEQARAEALANLGYVGVAVDVFGQGKRGTTNDECMALIKPLVGDRALLQKRVLAALDATRALPTVDAGRVAAIGFCFGGMCVLDLARSGADVRGVVSFHGLFMPSPLPKQPIKSKVLLCHGYDDPSVKPDAMVAMCNELTAGGSDWQLHAYGGTMHAFTNPNANDPSIGNRYNPDADRRSRVAMEQFLAECLAG